MRTWLLQAMVDRKGFYYRYEGENSSKRLSGRPWERWWVNERGNEERGDQEQIAKNQETERERRAKRAQGLKWLNYIGKRSPGEGKHSPVPRLERFRGQGEKRWEEPQVRLVLVFFFGGGEDLTKLCMINAILQSLPLPIFLT